MLFENTDFDWEMNFYKIPGNEIFLKNRMSRFLDSEEGFIRGNLEANTYVPYKNYQCEKLMPKNEREKQLYKIMELSFAINELNLYLDLHPEDIENFNLFKKYVEEINDLEMKYSKEYGPLCLSETLNKNYDWLKNPWPWDKLGDSKYV